MLTVPFHDTVAVLSVAEPSATAHSTFCFPRKHATSLMCTLFPSASGMVPRSMTFVFPDVALTLYVLKAPSAFVLSSLISSTRALFHPLTLSYSFLTLSPADDTVMYSVLSVATLTAITFPDTLIPFPAVYTSMSDVKIDVFLAVCVRYIERE